MTFIAVHIASQQEKDELSKAFEQLDKNGDGVLTKAELIEGYSKVYDNRQKAEEMVKSIWDGLDINGSGDINFTGYLDY